MDRQRCSELLDIILANRGLRRDAVDQFRVSLPFASGTQCRRAICQLHELLSGKTIDLTPVVFSRAKLELQHCGIGVLEFHSSRTLDTSTWTAFDPAHWRENTDGLYKARQRVVPPTFRCRSLDIPATAANFSSWQLELLTQDSLFGVPSGLKQAVNAFKLHAHENLTKS